MYKSVLPNEIIHPLSAGSIPIRLCIPEAPNTIPRGVKAESYH